METDGAKPPETKAETKEEREAKAKAQAELDKMSHGGPASWTRRLGDVAIGVFTIGVPGAGVFTRLGCSRLGCQ
eukprot:551855-Prorocentrum_minimum.AAC.1